MKSKKSISAAATEIARYSPTPKDGLTAQQVETRKQAGLINGVKERAGKAYWTIFKNNALTLFDCILYAVALVYICFGIWSKAVDPQIVSDPDAYIGFSKYGFLNALLGNVIIGIFQEIKAKKAVDKLKLVDRQENIVIRDGKEQKIYSDDIVLDDIVIFKAGNTITVDGPVVEGVCQMNESMLTGESRTIKKQIGDTVYAGTFIVSGEISVRADKIGRDTSSGIIQNNIKQIKKKKSELMKSLNQIINIIAVVLIPISIGTMISLLKNNEIINLSTLDFANCTPAQVREILRILTTTGSAIIGSIPTGLILLTSVTLATSVLKLSAVKTIVKDMYSVESLSRIDTICFDKTGTLTTGAQTVQDVILCKQYKREFQGTPINDILGCYIHALPADNPTSIAITKYFNSNQKYQIIDKTFFTSDTKHTSVTMSMNGENVKFYLGAPEYLTEDKNLLRQVEDFNKTGLRVVLFAKAEAKRNIPLALIVMQDEIRSSVIDTIKYFNQNDVSVKVISGDNPITVSSIAKICGISGYDKYISLENVPDEKIYDLIDDFTIFARVTPDQKRILVDALQKKGHKVCMTGDGINDIVAMQKAEASVSFKNATDVTKSIADIVLIDNDFSHMKDVVMEGRRAVNNMERIASIFLMKSFFTLLYQIYGILAGPISIQSEFYGLMEGFAIGFAGVLLSFEGNYSKFKGNFMSHVLGQAIPAAAFLLVSVLSVYIMQASGLISDDTAASLAMQYPGVTAEWINEWPSISSMHVLLTLVFTISSFAVLFKQCCPLNKYRTFTFVIVLVCGLFAMVLMPHTYLLWQSVGLENPSTHTINIIGYFKDMFAVFVPSSTYHVQASLFFADSGWWFIRHPKIMLIALVYSGISIPFYFLFYYAAGKIQTHFKQRIFELDDDEKEKPTRQKK